MRPLFFDTRRLETVARFNRLVPNAALDRVVTSTAAALGMAGAAAFLVSSTSVRVLAGFGLKSGPVERALPENLSIVLPNGATSMTDRNGELGGMIASQELIASLFSAPLIASNGNPIGSLCAFDQRALNLHPEQGMLLENLARSLTDLLEAQLERSEALDSARRDLATGALRELDHPSEDLGRESGQLAQYILESADAAIIALSLEGRVLRWNAGAERLYGYTASDALGRVIDFLMPEFFTANWRAINQHVITTGRALDLESVHRHRDGRLIEVRLQFAPLLDERERPVGVWTTTTDVRDQGRTRQVLTDVVGRHKTLLEYAERQTRARELLERTGTILATVDDEQGVWKALFASVSATRGFEHVGLYRLEDGMLWLISAAGSELFEPSIPLAHGWVGQVASSGQGAIGDASDPVSDGAKLSVPIRSQGAVLGAMIVAGNERYDRDDLRTLAAVASQAALALARFRSAQASSSSPPSDATRAQTEPDAAVTPSDRHLEKTDSRPSDEQAVRKPSLRVETAVPVPRKTLQLLPDRDSSDEVGLVVLANLDLALRYAAGVGGLESFTAGMLHRPEWGGDLVVLRNKTLRLIILKCNLEDLPTQIRRDPEIAAN